MSKKKAIVLLSGGLDSATALAVARDQGYGTYTLSFDYDQRHRHELECADLISLNMGAYGHQEVKISTFGGSALNDPTIEVPKGRSLQEMVESIPITYVPARNTIFLSFALSCAEVIDADAIFTGVNAVDYSGYPDCRPEFIEAYQRVVDIATKKTVQGGIIKVKTPLIHMSKVDIIKWGTELGVDYSMTSSCYDPDENGHACGRCDSCLIRKEAFEKAGIEDPTIYSKKGRNRGRY